jgi:hypothetical protein
MASSFLQAAIMQFKYYKSLGDKTINQLSDDDLFVKPLNDNTNSIAIIIQHLAGNMQSRFTNFLTEDGEKPWRKREEEFDTTIMNKSELLSIWESGWNTLFITLESLTESELEKIVYIRNQGHTVTEAIARQLCHYGYHVGQIVFIGTMFKGNNWQSLSIPKGNSTAYNEAHFAKPKTIEHFTKN